MKANMDWVLSDMIEDELSKELETINKKLEQVIQENAELKQELRRRMKGLNKIYNTI